MCCDIENNRFAFYHRAVKIMPGTEFKNSYGAPSHIMSCLNLSSVTGGYLTYNSGSRRNCQVGNQTKADSAKQDPRGEAHRARYAELDRAVC